MSAGLLKILAISRLTPAHYALLRELSMGDIVLGMNGIWRLYEKHPDQVRDLVSAGLWYQHSASQGHITEAGIEALKARPQTVQERTPIVQQVVDPDLATMLADELRKQLSPVFGQYDLSISARDSYRDGRRDVAMTWHRLRPGEEAPNGIKMNAPGLLLVTSGIGPDNKIEVYALRTDGSRAQWGTDVPRFRKYTSKGTGAQGVSEVAGYVVRWFERNKGALLGTTRTQAPATRAREPRVGRQAPQARQQSPAPSIASQSEIPADLARRAFEGTSFAAQRRGTSVRSEYAQLVNTVYADLLKLARTPDQRALVQSEMETLKGRFLGAYKAWLTSRSGTTSWMITGRSGRNAAREDKKARSAERRLQEAMEILDKGKARILKKLKGVAVEQAGGPLALARKKLAGLERLQETMKAANRIVRRKVSDQEKISKLVELQGIGAQTARELLKPDFAGRVGFADYRIKNNNAEIRRMRQRVAELQAAEQRAARAQQLGEQELSFDFEGSEEYPYAGTVVYDFADDRLRLSFDERIPREVFQKIRRTTGFNWSRANEAFQHGLSDRGVLTARRITGREDLPYLDKITGRR